MLSCTQSQRPVSESSEGSDQKRTVCEEYTRKTNTAFQKIHLSTSSNIKKQQTQASIRADCIKEDIIRESTTINAEFLVVSNIELIFLSEGQGQKNYQ